MARARRPRRPMTLVPPSVQEPERTIVYRLYDTTDALLYVGVTADLHRRLIMHRQTKAWFDEVDRVGYLIYPNARQAASAEEGAIGYLKPRYNRSGIRRTVDPLQTWWFRILMGPVAA